MATTMMRVLLGISILGIGAAAPAAESHPVAVPGDAFTSHMAYYDKWTDLTWQRCSVGQQWEYETGCVGSVRTFTFSDAQHLTAGTWRVPTKDELATLIDYRRRAGTVKPTIDETRFPDMDIGKLVYWSSTPAGGADGWGVYFDAGYAGNYDRSDAYAVRLVRSGQ